MEEDIELDIDTTSASSYAGHFDGQNHTISNQRWRLFVRLEKTVLVENLILRDVNIQYKKVNQRTNICPTNWYEEVIEQGFYPIDGKESQMEIQEGDSLSK